MNRFLTKFSTNRNIAILFVLFLGFNLWILPSMMPGEKPLDLEIFYTAEEAYVKVEGFSSEVRESYRMGLMVSDMLYPMVYGALFSFVIFRLWQNEKLVALPLFIMIFDIIENIGIINVLILYPEKSHFWGSLAGISTAIKWSFTAITILIVLVGVGKKVLLKK
ncbi:hypothetical protein M3O96_14040 [Aquiflexum sp. TKW24L]|uniref:hypothetical protein n=1 Tax=Aquiflexum sp. TKW24L TaxID=2942212 RepID=UPI0020C087FD|nr:hypothetical protein [Aquiflexum sp. TKW24L]MCL6260217.1 hypothetical protein [Aquiflexum sp. TKW24L]